jgi:hypothetical protein
MRHSGVREEFFSKTGSSSHSWIEKKDRNLQGEWQLTIANRGRWGVDRLHGKSWKE